MGLLCPQVSGVKEHNRMRFFCGEGRGGGTTKEMGEIHLNGRDTFGGLVCVGKIRMGDSPSFVWHTEIPHNFVVTLLMIMGQRGGLATKFHGTE